MCSHRHRFLKGQICPSPRTDFLLLIAQKLFFLIFKILNVLVEVHTEPFYNASFEVYSSWTVEDQLLEFPSNNQALQCWVFLEFNGTYCEIIIALSFKYRVWHSSIFRKYGCCKACGNKCWLLSNTSWSPPIARISPSEYCYSVCGLSGYGFSSALKLSYMP